MDSGGGEGDTVIVPTSLQGQQEIQTNILRKELSNEA